MRIAVASCYGYRDCWHPWFELWSKFWPDCPYEAWLLTDRYESGLIHQPHRVYEHQSTSWCEILAGFAATHSGPTLLVQEDFLLNAKVDQRKIEWALGRLNATKAGHVRLYPCPGADEDYGDPYIGLVHPTSPYSISCQASIFSSDYLYQIASQCGTTPADFEIRGSQLAAQINRVLLSWKRQAEPWSLSYLCSAIGRGLWSQDAKRLCDREGVVVDWSMRWFQPA